MVLAIETERLTAGFHRYHSVTDDRGDLVYLVRDLERAEYYSGPTTVPSDPTPPVVSEERRARGLIHRLTGSLRRRG